MELFKNGYALLIGVNEQEADIEIQSLPAVANDIKALETVLLHPERCGYPPENVFTLTSKEATRGNIVKSLTWLVEEAKKAENGDVTVFVFYSGHGFRDPEGKFHLIPYDAKMEFGQVSNTIADDLLKAALNQIAPKRLLLILDCCHAGATAAKALNNATAADPVSLINAISTKQPSATDKEVISKAVVREEPTPPTTQGDDSKPIISRSTVPPVIIGDGRVVMASSQGEELSFLRDKKDMSIFTHCLVEGLTGHAPRMEGATEVSVLSVMDYVSGMVPFYAQNKRKPQEQHPTFQLAGDNFPVAKLLGGQGLQGKPPSADQPLELPQPVVNTYKTNNATISAAFGIINQDITNSTISITQSGNQANTDNSTHAGRDANQASEGSTQHVDNSTHTTGPDLASLFKTVLEDIQKKAEADPTVDADLLKARTESAQRELKKAPEKVNESKVRKWLDALRENAPDILGKVADVVANPGEGVAIGIRTIADLIKKVNA